MRPEPVATSSRWYAVPRVVFLAARAGARRAAFMAPVDELDPAAHTVVSADMQAGFAVQPGGELTQVFNYGRPGQGREAVAVAIEAGATHLNCFDGFLVRFYRSLGFKEDERLPFDDNLAPTDWDYERDGRPDVVFMSREGTTESNGKEHTA